MKKIFLLLVFICSGVVINAQDSLTQYVGKYIFGPAGPVSEADVLIENGSLKMSSSSGTSTLSQLGVDSFSIVEYSGTAVFKRNDEKKVNGVHIAVMGYIMDGKKQDSGLWIFASYYLTAKNGVFIRKLSEAVAE